MSSIRTLVKDRIMAVITEVEPESGWKVMIVDKISVRIISSACRMFDITDEGVTIVENLEIERQPMPDMEAIYLISPTEESVRQLCRDFGNENEPKYEAAHVYFTSNAKDAVLFSIKTTAGLRRRLKCLKELNLEFLALEQRGFSLDLTDAFHCLYGNNVPDGEFMRRRDEMQAQIAERLTTVCVTLGERPYIRYKKSKDPADCSENIARLVEQGLDNVERMALGVQLWDNYPPNEKPQLIIVDRREDPLTPLMHDYTYQAMAYDIMDIRDDRYSYAYSNAKGEQVQKETLLNEQDVLWPKLRHLHIADAITSVLDDFNSFTRESKAAGLVKKEVTDIKDMAAAIKSMPQYKELVSKYSLHMDLTRKCMGAYEARGLELVSTQEQNIATGSDAQGKTVKNQQQLVQSVLENLQPSEEDKMRLLLIWAMQDGVTESDLEPMLHAAKLTGRHQQTIQNLELLNVVMQKKGTRPSFFKSKTHKPTKTQDGAYDLARYRPPLEQVMHAFCEGKLSGEEYPYTSPPPSTKGIGPISSRLGQSVRTRPRGDKLKSRLQGDDDDNDGDDDDDSVKSPKFIVFVVGGMSYSEICSAYLVSRDTESEVAIGSTEVMSPNRYLKSLEGLHLETPPPLIRTQPKPLNPEAGKDEEGTAQ